MKDTNRHTSYSSRQVDLLAMLKAVTDKLGLCLTRHAYPSSMAALWASTGLSITLPILPEKSIATREFSDTLRYRKGEYRVIKVDTCQQLPHGTNHADKKDG